MQYTEIVAVLRRTPFFAQLDKPTQKLLAFSSSYVSFKPGEIVFHQGERSDSVLLIDEGSAEVSLNTGGGEVVVGCLGPNDLVGEMGIFRNLPRSATVRAVRQTTMLRFEAEIFLKLVTGNPTAALAVMRNLSDKIATTTAALEQLTAGRTVAGGSDGV